MVWFPLHGLSLMKMSFNGLKNYAKPSPIFCSTLIYLLPQSVFLDSFGFCVCVCVFSLHPQGVLHTSVVLLTEMCERSPDMLSHFRKVRHSSHLLPLTLLYQLNTTTVISRI